MSYKYCHEVILHRFHRVITEKKGDVPLDSFLNNVGHVEILFEFIECSRLLHHHTHDTTRTYLSHLKQLALLHGLPLHEPENALLNEKFRLALKDHHNEAQLIESNNTLDSKMDEHWRTWEDIHGLYAALLQKRDLFPADYKLAQQCLLMSLYLFVPPLRMNYGNAAMFPREPLDEDNYVFLRDDACWFHLGQDKVSDSHGSMEFPLPKEAMENLQCIETRFGLRPFLLTLCKHTQKALFSRRAGAMYAQLLSTIPDLQGNPSHLRVFHFRSAKITHFIHEQHSVAEEQALAKSMRTSHSYFQSHYRKIYRADGTKIYT